LPKLGKSKSRSTSRARSAHPTTASASRGSSAATRMQASLLASLRLSGGPQS
jgi:hypothetical protein